MAKGSAIARKTMARLVAVQLLYKQTLEPVSTSALLNEYKNNMPMLSDEMEEMVDPDLNMVTTLLQGVDTQKAVIEEILQQRINAEQAAEPILFAILRCGVFELVYNTDTPVSVIISDYLSVSAAFYEGRETALVNGVLDTVGKIARPA